MKKRGLIQPNILIHFKDFNFDKIPDIQSLIGRFERLELVYFALEIINNKSLSSGYRKICSRLFPFDNGEKMMRLIDKELNIAYEDIAEHHLVCMQTGLELLNILLCCSPVHKPWDFDKIPNGAEIKGINLLTILLLVNERIINDIDVPVKNENPDISAKDILANVVAPTLVENSDYSNFDIVTSPLVYLYKSTLFLEFCATHPLLSPALNKVLEKYWEMIAKKECEVAEFNMKTRKSTPMKKQIEDIKREESDHEPTPQEIAQFLSDSKADFVSVVQNYRFANEFPF